MTADASWALTRHYPAGSVLFEEGDPGSRMYVIRSGKVRIFRRVGDNEIVLAFLGPGDFFGEMAILEQLPRSAHAELVEPSELVEVEADTFGEMVKRNSTIALRIMRKLAARVRHLDHRLEALLLDSALARALEVLRWLAQQGTPAGDWLQLPASASHVDIPAQAGIPHGQAATVMRQLETAHLLCWQGGLLRVAHADRLERFGTYLALKQQYEPAAAAALPSEAHVEQKGEMQQAMQRLFHALHMSPDDIAHNQKALAQQYQRFVALRDQFENQNGQESR